MGKKKKKPVDESYAVENRQENTEPRAYYVCFGAPPQVCKSSSSGRHNYGEFGEHACAHCGNYSASFGD